MNVKALNEASSLAKPFLSENNELSVNHENYIYNSKDVNDANQPCCLKMTYLMLFV